MIRAHLVVQKCTALQNPINKDKWAMETSMERTQEYVTAHIIHPQTAQLETQSLCVHTQSQSRILLSAYVCANTHKHTNWVKMKEIPIFLLWLAFFWHIWVCVYGWSRCTWSTRMCVFICFNISVCRGGLDRMCLLKMSYEKRLMTYLESVSTGGPDQGYYSFAFFTSFY